MGLQIVAQRFLPNSKKDRPANSLRQATPKTNEKPRLPEQQSQNAQRSDSWIRAELTKQAMLAIEYCPETASAWATVQKLPRKYQNCFLQIVGAKPQQDARKLAAMLLAKYRKVVRPYGNDEANNALANARTISAEAEAEFMMVYDLLGEKVKPCGIAEKNRDQIRTLTTDVNCTRTGKRSTRTKSAAAANS